MDITNYPILPWKAGRKLSDDDVIRMKLRLDVIPAGTVVWNEDPKHHAFWLDTIRKDRKGWFNEADELVYIEDCANRAMYPRPEFSYDGPLYQLVERPDDEAVPAPTPEQGGGGANNGSSELSNGSGFRMWGWLGDLWNGLGNLLLFLAALALLALLGALAYLFWRWLADWVQGGGSRNNPPPPAPAPPVQQAVPPAPRPTPPATPPVTAVTTQTEKGAPAVVPQPRATWAQYGPYDHIEDIEDAGKNGYFVNVTENGEALRLGPFHHARTENAGSEGEYLWAQTN